MLIIIIPISIERLLGTSENAIKLNKAQIRILAMPKGIRNVTSANSKALLNAQWAKAPQIPSEKINGNWLKVGIAI